MAGGEVGLTLDYFYSLTPREFDNILEGHRRKEENNFRATWEQTRSLMYAALAPHQKKGASFTPQKLMQFPWEKQEIDNGLPDADEIKKVQEFYKNYDARKIQA